MNPTERVLGLVVIGAGHVTLRAEDGLAQAEAFSREHGGEAALAAAACAQLGVETALVTRVGDDPFSNWLVSTWDAAGVHLDYVHHSAGRNILMLRSDKIDGGGAVVWREGTAPTGIEPEDLDGVPWEQTRVVYTSGATQALGDRPAQTVLAAFSAARRAGALTVFRPALREATWPPGASRVARAAFDDVLGMTDLLLVEAPFEAGRMLGQPTAEAALDEIARRGVSRAVVSLGSRGLHVMDRGERHLVPAESDAELDALMGPMLAALTGGASITEAVRSSVDSDDGASE